MDITDRAGQDDDDDKVAPRAGLPRLSRHPAIGEELRRAAARGRLPPWQRHRRDELRLGPPDPSAPARPSPPAGKRPRRRAPPGPPHPRAEAIPTEGRENLPP